jgi:ketosteroid isomerase-like protein
MNMHGTSLFDSRFPEYSSCYLQLRGVHMVQVSADYAKRFQSSIIVAFAFLAMAMPANAQKKDKNKNAAPPPDVTEEMKQAMRGPDSQVIDQSIGEALGYWQIGDTESLRKYYAEDVVVVSGAWEPPVIGWDNFLKSYQAQRAQISAARMDRINTLIKVNGNTAWATYQFTYAAQMNGTVVQFHGHTTLCLSKQAERWVITLNHSSIVDSSAPVPAASTGSIQVPDKP